MTDLYTDNVVDLRTAQKGLRVSSSRGNFRNQLIATRSAVLAQGNVAPGGVGGWRAQDPSSQTMTLDTSFVRRPGFATTKIDATAYPKGVAYFKTFRIKTNAVTRNGPVGLWVFAPPLSAGGLTFTLRWSSDTPASDPILATATNYYSMSFNANAQQRGHWMFLSISGPDGKVFATTSPLNTSPTVTGSPDPASIKQLELIISFTADAIPAERLVWLDNAECNGKAKPMIVIGFDGYNDDATSVGIKLAAFDKWGLTGYVAGDGNSAVANEASLDKFYDRGWDVISQGMNHIDYAANSGQLSEDYEEAIGIMRGLGYTRSLDMFCYPFNSRNLATDAILRAKGVRAARSFGGNARVPFNTTGTIDLLACGALDIGQKTAATLQTWVDEAVASGSHLVLYGHQIATSASTSLITATAEFNSMMDILGAAHQAGTLEVVPFSVLADRLLEAA